MPGLAISNDFMLGTATVMLGPVADLYDLNPTEHSIGLVKNFTANSAPAYTELTQGVKNSIVHSIMTANPVTCTMEAFEYTAKNLSYALGLEGAESVTENTVSTTLASKFTTGSPGLDLTVADSTGLTAGDYIMILSDNEDNFIIRKLVTVTPGSPDDTLVVDMKIDKDIPNGSIVRKVNMIAVGSKADQPFYAAKVAGKLANGEEVVILIPKVRIVKGFIVNFTTAAYGNLPIELTVYDLAASDTFYANFGGAQAQLFRR